MAPLVTHPDVQLMETAQAVKGRSLLTDARRRLFRNKAAVAGMVILAIITLMFRNTRWVRKRTWAAPDTRWAYYDDHGRLRIQNSPKMPAQITYARVLKFPASPQALVKYVYDWQSRIETVTPPDAVSDLLLATFLAITDLIKDYALPPRVGAELFHALPYIPGVRVMQAPGLVGFTWVWFTSLSKRIGLPVTSETIVLNPSTYAVTGVATVSASGKILAIMEVPTKIPVSGPGVRP